MDFLACLETQSVMGHENEFNVILRHLKQYITIPAH
jgi:hypothetical protein